MLCLVAPVKAGLAALQYLAACLWLPLAGQVPQVHFARLSARPATVLPLLALTPCTNACPSRLACLCFRARLLLSSCGCSAACPSGGREWWCCEPRCDEAWYSIQLSVRVLCIIDPRFCNPTLLYYPQGGARVSAGLAAHTAAACHHGRGRAAAGLPGRVPGLHRGRHLLAVHASCVPAGMPP